MHNYEAICTKVNFRDQTATVCEAANARGASGVTGVCSRLHAPINYQEQFCSASDVLNACSMAYLKQINKELWFFFFLCIIKTKTRNA